MQTDTPPALICAKRLQELIRNYLGEAPGYRTLHLLCRDTKDPMPTRCNPLAVGKKRQTMANIRFCWDEVREWLDRKSRETK